MKQLLLLTLGLLCYLSAVSQSLTISGNYDDPQISFALAKLRQQCVESDIYPISEGGKYTLHIGKDSTLGSEGYRMYENNRYSMGIRGGDITGIMYGILDLARQIRHTGSLDDITFGEYSPHLPFRAIKFNLPWDSYRRSPSLQQHMEICQKPEFWEKFLDMMAENRFNALTLWNLHPFNYMICPEGFPEACMNEAELAKWRKLYQTIFALARERGIETYIINWNIFVPESFAKEHGVALDNLGHGFFGKADTSGVIKAYTKACVTQLINEYPDLTGLGFSLGERMGDMTPSEREDWMLETFVEGAREASRKIKLIHRVPFSADLGSGGSTSHETEALTREAIESIEGVEGPVWVEIKFNWSHAHSTPRLVKTHGGRLHDVYWNPVPENYRIAWMARNEDIFCLRWGVPGFIRDHINTNTHTYVGGYFVGSECYIPAQDYFTDERQKVSWKYAFERQWLFYMTWGNLLYNPGTPDKLFEQEFVYRYGKNGRKLLEAHELVGRMPLELASFQDLRWDFTMYAEGFLAKWGEEPARFITLERLISNPPLDPTYLSIPDYVRMVRNDKPIPPGYTTPKVLADRLEANAEKALKLLNSVENAELILNRDLMYEVADIQAWSYLSLYFAEKIRAAIGRHTFRTGGIQQHHLDAVKHLDNATGHWEKLVEITRPIYRDMPLVHLNGSEDVYFHWEKLLDDVRAEADRVRSGN